MKRLVIGAALGVAILSGVIVAPPALASPAHSATPQAAWCGWTPANNSNVPGTFSNAGVNIRNGQYTNCTVLGAGYNGHDLTFRCFADGTSVGGNGVWIYLTDRTTGVTGWASAAYIWGYGENPIVHC
ncbi:hypothetical protein V2S66_34200 [Streptomyces sp. V4-01]|uniref:SH3 domain-containing protein n=1 Tax=Actinacidiphila polyblastidii TaxID=3110430 RepID=A0ABU7PMD9_9ACTN|nr:hypothetical protein [Streptomyces sp. V4-01]